MAKKVVEMEVESVRMELPDTKTVRLRWPEGYDVEFKTGQFITVFFGDAQRYKRAYSLSSCALDRGFFEVTVKRDGKMGTRIVDWVKEGDRLFVVAPTGRFLPVFEDGAHLVCLAGGSGVTPFRGFVREATRRGLGTRITVLYSVRRPVDVIFDGEFRELEGLNGGFRFWVTCTRVGEGDVWEGRRGRIDVGWVREAAGDLGGCFFYVCGPTALVEGMEGLLSGELGVGRDRVRLEKWG